MNALRSTILVFFATTLWLGSLIAAAWAVSVKSNTPIAIRGAGSTFASLLYAKWINAFSGTFPNVTINYDAVGSDEGIARFIGQTVDLRVPTR
ncbi:MAG TPA: substrate-binding domain-containing protein [Xanthobacteraceae bacterium]|nr:substrate-binding domain-containing protein [Xanthobacteraceae bacterium]